MKTILITGSTDGIGKLAAIQLAKEGHQIIVHGRTKEKLERAVSEIKAVSNNKNILSFISDFSDLESVKNMVGEITQEVSTIDVIINNAGVFTSPIQKNDKGLDMRFAVNFFAPYVLTNGLISLMKEANSPKLINVSSAAQSTVSIQALYGKELPSIHETYAQSKLALTMWSFYFAKLYPEVMTVAVNPGSLLNTKMANEAYGRHWAPADKGSNILYELTLFEDHISGVGKYFDNDQEAFSNAHTDAYNDEKIALLIAETKKIVKG
ncbi:short subunit dehydrogenase [Roseivirga ehrenbergii]|uniref:Short-chain dehydrogenase n=1 Tax=Roseivirga ehrenbergii (strain DSM 102268 / JCM 13514 / KCTC 12282 / NCIMB 14502 / KMM 6017) TaxID=279360 RepID=A0A150X7S2_ROSEK|nr:SDR family NAD(P)-dependent oxidoreductase [Roseivirga ehrenbergii]KYG74712.1 short-chain dehydrogenase [Roseivirga ehrenbergii]TCL13963.1 short subunit dehydrogenase [Roseivirga ehrenbergii]